jgi:hypothetical protein
MSAGRTNRMVAATLTHRNGCWQIHVADPLNEAEPGLTRDAAGSLKRARWLAREMAAAVGFTNISSRWRADGPDWELLADWHEVGYDDETETWS